MTQGCAKPGLPGAAESQPALRARAFGRYPVLVVRLRPNSGNPISPLRRLAPDQGAFVFGEFVDQGA
ncbi:MAG: hypothetical protein QOG10_3779 [Kribbellaceae bacterium]|nr:hypothetical protein [Kribbellaceae bacterium]